MKDKARIAALKAQPEYLEPGQEGQPIQPADGKKFTLTELTQLFSCRDIEQVRLPGTGLLLLLDGEGKLSGRPSNKAATALWDTLMPGAAQYDYVAGPAVVCATPLLRC